MLSSTPIPLLTNSVSKFAKICATHLLSFISGTTSTRYQCMSLNNDLKEPNVLASSNSLFLTSDGVLVSRNPETNFALQFLSSFGIIDGPPEVRNEKAIDRNRLSSCIVYAALYQIFKFQCGVLHVAEELEKLDSPIPILLETRICFAFMGCFAIECPTLIGNQKKQLRNTLDANNYAQVVENFFVKLTFKLDDLMYNEIVTKLSTYFCCRDTRSCTSWLRILAMKETLEQESGED